MAKTKKKPSFNCDVNGGIMVTCALRYSLGRMTYVPGAVQDWIKTYWDSLDSNTKCVVMRDVFDFLYDEFRTSGKHHTPFNGYDIKEWEKFSINRFWSMKEEEQQYIYDNHFTNIGNNHRSQWWTEIMEPKLCQDDHEL
jgi:hypothetical protein